MQKNNVFVADRARMMSGKDDGFGLPPLPFGKLPDDERSAESRVFKSRGLVARNVSHFN